MEMTLTNVVASGQLSSPIDLAEFFTIDLEVFNNTVKYNPKTFPAVIIPLRESKVTALLFRTGKVNLVGGKSSSNIKQASEELISRIMLQGHDVTMTTMEIKNMVGSSKMPFRISLERLVSDQPKEAYFCPELFPGVRYSVPGKRMVFTVFHNGKCYCTGARNLPELKDTFDWFFEILMKYKIGQ